jgi:hypothetical protein
MALVAGRLSTSLRSALPAVSVRLYHPNVRPPLPPTRPVSFRILYARLHDTAVGLAREAAVRVGRIVGQLAAPGAARYHTTCKP